MAHHVPLVSYAVQSRGPVLSGMMLDNGVALMAAHLLAAGYRPKIFDYNNTATVAAIASGGHADFIDAVTEELAEYVARYDVRLLGFKLYLNGFRDAVRIAAELRARFPRLLLLMGGPQVDWFGASVFEITRRWHGREVFDAAVFGDADLAIAAVADAVYRDGPDLSGIPNLLVNRSGVVERTRRRTYDLTHPPTPVYDPQIYDSRGKILIPVVEDSRSCDTACSFCIQPRIGGPRRVRPIEAVLAEVESYRRDYGWRLFRLSGPKPSGAYLAALAAALPGDSRFSAFGYADDRYDDVVATGKLVGLFTGLESVDPRVLAQVFRKTDDVPRYLGGARDLIAAFKGRGLANVVSMIVPAADDDAASMARTFDFLAETAPDFVPCLPVGPMPGTPLTRAARDNPERLGVRLDADYEEKLAQFETDLLQPPERWPQPPWEVRVGGRWVRNAFAEVTAGFVARLAKEGIHMLSDEQVLMAYLYHDGLDAAQERRRSQCVGFNQQAREAIAKGDAGTLGALVARVNAGQRATTTEAVA